jgi:hypothetical protein
MSFAALLLFSSVMSSDFATTDWLSAMQKADVIAVVETTKSGDLAPEYKVLDGIVGVAKGDVISIGAEWPLDISWPEARGVGERFLVFAAKKPYELSRVPLDEACRS